VHTVYSKIPTQYRGFGKRLHFQTKFRQQERRGLILSGDRQRQFPQVGALKRFLGSNRRLFSPHKGGYTQFMWGFLAHRRGTHGIRHYKEGYHRECNRGGKLESKY